MKKNLLKAAFLGLAALVGGSSAFAAVGDKVTILDQTFTGSPTLTNTDAYTWGDDVQSMLNEANGLYLTNNSNKSNNYENRDLVTFTNPVGDATHEVNISYPAYCTKDKGQSNTYYTISYFNENDEMVFGIQEWSGGWGFGANIICATADGTPTTTSLSGSHIGKGTGTTVNITVKFSDDTAVISIDGGTYSAYTKSAGIKSVKMSVSGDNGYDRDMYVKSFTISTTEIEAVAVAKYTLDYNVDGTTVKTVEKSGTVGDAISLSSDDIADFIEDGVKYIYVSNDAEGKTVAADGTTVVTLTYRVAATYNYTIKNNVNDEVIMGSCYEGESVTQPYKKYILASDGVLWEKAAINSGYNYSFTPDADNYEVTLDYSATSLTGVVYYSEAEDIESLAYGAGSNADIRCSNAAGGYPEKDAIITTLQPGIYTLTVSTRTNSVTNFVFTTGDQEVYNFESTKGNTFTGTSETFTVSKETDLVVLKAGSANNIIDYLFITKTGDVDPNVTYTLDYVCDGETIKSVKKEAIAGDPIVLTDEDKADFYNEDKTVKYIYVSDNAEENEVAAADGSTVITLIYRAAASYKYTVKTSNPETTLAEGTSFEGEEVVVYYPKYLQIGNRLSECPATDGGYKKVYEFTEDTDVVLDYEATNITYVEFLAEAEDIKTLVASDVQKDFTSFGKGAYAKEDAVITNLNEGSYAITAAAYTENPVEFVFTAGDTVLTLTTTAESASEATSELFTLGEPTDLVLKAAGTPADLLDYIYIVREDVSGVNGIAADSEEGEWYNLQGIRVTKPVKGGIYIHNGKKVVVK